jgi:hypothetical protein
MLAHKLDLEMLVKRIYVKKQNQTHKTQDRIAKRREGKFRSVHVQRRESERNDGSGQQ